MKQVATIILEVFLFAVCRWIADVTGLDYDAIIHGGLAYMVLRVMVENAADEKKGGRDA
jgi:hypothetical protein